MQGAARIGEIFAGSPADRAGLQPGDTLVSGDGVPLQDKSQAELLNFLAGRPAVTLVIRNTQGHESKVTLQKQAAREFEDASHQVTVKAMDFQFSTLTVGQLAPDFEASTPDGRTIQLRSLKGKPVVVVFWATWCLPCFVELQTLKSLYARLHPAGLEIVGVSLDDNEPKFRAFLKQNHVPWPQQFDGNGWSNHVAQAWSVVHLPGTVLIGRDGKIAQLVANDLARDELQSAIEHLAQ
ncbi:MAG: redoxin domain-containing protein [Chthoniobacteraceae bacterium]